MKLVTVVGARPQFVKAAVVSRALRHSNLQECIVHTGQHYDTNMSGVFFTEMQIPAPAYNLAVQESLHGAMTGKMMAGIEQVLLKEQPAAVLIYGDTNSTLAAALAAVKLHIPVAHVEAGLRSFNMRMPEEVNRIMADRVSTLLFCPTQQAADNLAAEGITPPYHHVHRTGDVMFDAALYYLAQSNDAIIHTLGLAGRPFILATLHRAENTDDPARLASITEALNRLHEQVQVVVPLHPRTAKRMQQQGLQPRFTIIDPVGYFDMLQLLRHCALVITDSGGLQKEAYCFRKYCVVMRDQTEWVELLQQGCSAIAGADTKKITDIAAAFLQAPYTAAEGLYGDGRAGETIVNILESHLYARCAS